MPVALKRRPARPSIRTATIPAPVGGLNTVSAGMAMPVTDCLRAYNLIASEYGLRSRLGSREWCTGLTGASDNLVRAIIPFKGSAGDGTKDRLFATTSTGIWDCTSSSETPTQVLAFSSSSGGAGYGVSHAYVNTAGAHFLFFADETNGLFLYTESSDTWAASGITGVTPGNVNFVTVHKQRAWVVLKDSAIAYYLPAGAITGAAAASAIDFGNKFRAGGNLIGLWSWTYDGGAGMDDALVGISSGGDVVVFAGTNPADAATWAMKGVWSIAAPVSGRSIASNFGGDLLILSRAGLVSMSELVLGRTGPGAYPTAKISNLFNSLAISKASMRGWSIRLHPEDAALIITVPTSTSNDTEQLVMSLAAKSWSRYRSLPLYSSESLNGKFYLGSDDGRVLINDGYVDGVTLADVNSYTPVAWDLLTAFNNLGSASCKQVQAIRPTIICDGGIPTYRAGARYKYDLTELSAPSSSVPGGDTWDAGLWDTAVWAGEYQATQAVTGAVGMGVDVAIAVRGTSTARTVLVGLDLAYTEGGWL